MRGGTFAQAYFSPSAMYAFSNAAVLITEERALFGIRFVASNLPGDFHNDEVVDAADYAVWRKQGGTPAEYDTWRSHFGLHGGSGAGANTISGIPEPTTLIQFLFGIMASFRFRRKATSNALNRKAIHR